MQKKQWWFIAGLVLLVLIIIGIERWIGWQTLLEPWYRIAPGTLILATLLTVYLGSLLILRRLTLAPPRERVLQSEGQT